MRFGVGDFSGQRPPGSSVAHGQLYAELLEQGSRSKRQVSIRCGCLSTISRRTVTCRRCFDRGRASRSHQPDHGGDGSPPGFPARPHPPCRGRDRARPAEWGRFILGLSLCYRDEEFSGFGVEAATDPQRLEAWFRCCARHSTAVQQLSASANRASPLARSRPVDRS